MLRYGFLDRPQFDPSGSTYSVADGAIALDGARESITLLKNEGHLLPLDPARIKTIAVIGPNAYPAVTGGGRSSQAHAFEPVSILTGIANAAGADVRVLYSRGLPAMADIFRGTQWEGGLSVATYPSKDFSGTPQRSTPRSIADWKPDMWGPEDKSPRSMRYSTAFKAEKAGNYLVLAAASGEDAYKVLIDGQPLLAAPHAEGQSPQCWPLDLNAGQTVKVAVEYLPHSPGVRFGLGMAYEPELVSADAKQFAAIADAVVVAVGFNPPTEGEGYDRTFTLPWGQDALIEAMAAANPHTIVTLNGGGGMDTRAGWTRFPRCCTPTIPARRAARPSARSSSASTTPRASCRSASTAVGRRTPRPPTTTRSRAPTPCCT